MTPLLILIEGRKPSVFCGYALLRLTADDIKITNVLGYTHRVYSLERAIFQQNLDVSLAVRMGNGLKLHDEGYLIDRQ